MGTVFFTRDDFRKVKKIKIIAQWFLFLQSILLIGWAFSAKFYLEYLFTMQGSMIAFPVSFVYFITFCLITINIIFKKPALLTIQWATLKLVIVAILALIPSFILVASYFLFIH